MWIINAGFAALNVAIVYRLAGEIFSRRVGLIAAALLAFLADGLAAQWNADEPHLVVVFRYRAYLCLLAHRKERSHDTRHAWRWGRDWWCRALGLLTISRPSQVESPSHAPFVAVECCAVGLCK